MSAKFRTEGRVALAASRLYALMTSPEHQETVAKNFKAITAKAKVEEASQGPLLTIELEEPERDGSGTERSTMRFEWNAQTMSCTWSRFDHQHKERVKVSGSLKLLADGEQACRIVEEGEIEISIPFIGGRIASKLASSIERKREAVYRFWEDLGKR